MSRKNDFSDPPSSAAVAIEDVLRSLSPSRELSRREVEIVAAAVRGLDTKATAAALILSPKTVDEYWRRVYRKLCCHSRLEVLARLYVRSAHAVINGSTLSLMREA